MLEWMGKVMGEGLLRQWGVVRAGRRFRIRSLALKRCSRMGCGVRVKDGGRIDWAGRVFDLRCLDFGSGVWFTEWKGFMIMAL